MKKVAFRNLGCKVNEYEMEYMQQVMTKNGYKIVPFDTIADIYVINTCTVTNIADRKSRQMLHKAKKLNPNAIVVATGCYAQTDTDGAYNDPAVDIIVGNNKKAELPNIIEEYIDSKQIKKMEVIDVASAYEYEDMHITHTQEHTRAFIKIQDGCEQFCSYCAIPLARGRVRSRSLENILSEVKDLALNGYKEVVITGIHLSSYGVDFHQKENGQIPKYNELNKDNAYTNEDLLNVIKNVALIDGIKRIRLGSLEPRLITDKFVEEISKIDKICPHFHLSLQSGCDETLKRMNRQYTCSEYLNGVRLLRNGFNNPAITTDVIVGFPGESDEEFNITKEYLKKIRFFELHVFKYSKRKNTVAAKMKNQVPDSIKDIRSDELINMDNIFTSDFKNSYLNKMVEVLFEEEKDGIFIGHTKEYIKVGIKTDEDLKGEIRTLMLDGETLFFV